MKDYKKILEGVVDIINTTEKSDIGFANICAYIGENCPELKESKDERIRKSIIGFLITISSLKDEKTVSNEDFDSKAILEWVAWLEKQGEQKPVEPQDLSEFKRQLKEYLLEEGWNAIDPRSLNESVEYKAERLLSLIPMPVDWSDDDEAKLSAICSDIMSYSPDCFKDNSSKVDWLKSLKCRCLPKSKQEWSEEDSANIKDVIAIIMNSNYSEGTKEHYIDCLKSLKDRVQPQPKQEWSEEDEEMIDSIIGNIKYLYSIGSCDNATVDKKVNWLKSLSTQNTWKPSEEQMHYLSWIANVKLGDSVVEQEVSKHLNELLEDLKKLREE